MRQPTPHIATSHDQGHLPLRSVIPSITSSLGIFNPNISPAEQRSKLKGRNDHAKMAHKECQSSVTVCGAHCSIPIPAVSRSLWLGFRSSDSFSYPLSAKPAPQRLRIPPALGIPVKYSG